MDVAEQAFGFALARATCAPERRLQNNKLFRRGWSVGLAVRRSMRIKPHRKGNTIDGFVLSYLWMVTIGPKPKR